MWKWTGPLLLSIVLCYQVNAQFIYKGQVVDSLSKKPIKGVSIKNMDNQLGTVSDEGGNFSVPASAGHYIVISSLGYKNYVIIVKKEDDLIQSHTIYLQTKAIQLKDVTIKKPLTKYQEDSIKRASLYKKAFEYKQQKSIMSPISSLQQKFSKKYKNLRKFQDQILKMEDEKFIETRYNVDLVMQLTNATEEQAWQFIKNNPMEIDYARTASDLEIKMWIKNNYKTYKAESKKKVN
jgi:hypothetical protein